MMSEWANTDIPDQSGRIIVITGANSGIGYESAVALAQKNANVVMACRNLEKAGQARRHLLNRAPDASVTILPLDLSSLASIHHFAETFATRYQRLDVLMNNAGVMMPPYGKTADGFELQFGANHLGHFALTGLLLPQLLATPHSRIVTISSSTANGASINFNDLQSEQHYARWQAYGQSKLANQMFMRELQHRLEAVHADTISVGSHPGYAVTNIQSQTSPLQKLGMQIIKPLLAQPADLGARYQLYAATMPDVRGGDYFGPRRMTVGAVVRAKLNSQVNDTALLTRLWEVSEQLTGVHYEVLNSAQMPNLT